MYTSLRRTFQAHVNHYQVVYECSLAIGIAHVWWFLWTISHVLKLNTRVHHTYVHHVYKALCVPLRRQPRFYSYSVLA
jgi:hypothetical protein